MTKFRTGPAVQVGAQSQCIFYDCTIHTIDISNNLCVRAANSIAVCGRFFLIPIRWVINFELLPRDESANVNFSNFIVPVWHKLHMRDIWSKVITKLSRPSCCTRGKLKSRRCYYLLSRSMHECAIGRAGMLGTEHITKLLDQNPQNTRKLPGITNQTFMRYNPTQ